MTTPEQAPPPAEPAPCAIAWQELIATDLDDSRIDGFPLEHLIALQQPRTDGNGASR